MKRNQLIVGCVYSSNEGRSRVIVSFDIDKQGRWQTSYRKVGTLPIRNNIFIFPEIQKCTLETFHRFARKGYSQREFLKKILKDSEPIEQEGGHESK